MTQIDYFFSPVSPFTYLAGDRLEQLATEVGARIRYIPFDIGAVFGATGGVPVGQRSPQRQAYRLQELKRIQVKTGLPFQVHPAHFPVDGTAACLTLIQARDQGYPVDPLAHACLEAVWARDLNLADVMVLGQLLDSVQLPRSLLDTRDEARATFAAETDEAIQRGVFGSPFYVVGDACFWGQDRLTDLKTHLQQLSKQSGP